MNGKKGSIISINELTGSDAGCGDTITVKLDEEGYKVEINFQINFISTIFFFSFHYYFIILFLC
jgi:hypothetical protein